MWPRPRRRGAATVMLAALFGAVVGTGGTLVAVGTDGDGGDSVAAPAPDDGQQVQAPSLDVDGLESGDVVPAFAAAQIGQSENCPRRTTGWPWSSTSARKRDGSIAGRSGTASN